MNIFKKLISCDMFTDIETTLYYIGFHHALLCVGLNERNDFRGRLFRNKNNNSKKKLEKGLSTIHNKKILH